MNRSYFPNKLQIITGLQILLCIIYYIIMVHYNTVFPEVNRSRTWTPQFQRIKYKRNANLLDYRGSVIKDINRRLQESLKNDKGTGCLIPKMDPFDKEIVRFDKMLPKIVCQGMDWVRCHLSQCRVKSRVLKKHKNVICVYKDLKFLDDFKSYFGKEVTLAGNAVYTLTQSDHVKVTCYENKVGGKPEWSGYAAGFRKVVPRKPPSGRESTLNVLIFGFDSVSKNGLIRRMPLSYKALLHDMNAVILNGYNIVGDGTTAALFPILTGNTELEMPDVRKVMKNQFVDILPFIFYKLRDDGYRTAYLEDMPWGGTFQYRHNGWTKQPTDHYLRHLLSREFNFGVKYKRNLGKSAAYCTGDTPTYALLMNLTTAFFKLDGKKYCFTFIGDISHDDFNMIQSADEDMVAFLRRFKHDGRLENTLLIVMGDHGPRWHSYSQGIRSTFPGKLEERHPLMAIILPEKLKRSRPEALKALKGNVEVLTTPHDIYATVLDVMDMRHHWNPYKVPGADLTRGLTLLEPVPATRSCSEAGIEPHWCTCMQWVRIPTADPLFNRTVEVVVNYINALTQTKRSECMPRYLMSAEYVMKQQANSGLLRFQNATNRDQLLGKFGKETSVNREEYIVRVTLGPGNSNFEASLSYLKPEKKFKIHYRDIQRTNAYGKEPACISAHDPHLLFFCYCRNYKQPSNLNNIQDNTSDTSKLNRIRENTIRDRSNLNKIQNNTTRDTSTLNKIQNNITRDALKLNKIKNNSPIKSKLNKITRKETRLNKIRNNIRFKVL